MHLGIDPQEVVAAVESSGGDEMVLEGALKALLPAEVNAAEWNQELLQKGATEAGREFLRDALTAMGCPGMVGQVKSVCELIDFDEGRIPGFVVRPEGY